MEVASPHIAAASPIPSPSAYCLSSSASARSNFPSVHVGPVSRNIAARFSPSFRAPAYSFRASAREASYLPWNMRLLAMPMNDGANCGFTSSAFRYWAMDSSNRPIFISSSAYES